MDFVTELLPYLLAVVAILLILCRRRVHRLYQQLRQPFRTPRRVGDTGKDKVSDESNLGDRICVHAGFAIRSQSDTMRNAL
jgi:hypothetical protein